VTARHCPGCNGFGPGWEGDCPGIDAAAFRSSLVYLIGLVAGMKKITRPTGDEWQGWIDRLDQAAGEMADLMPENADS
jgi:hypothetical protein